MKIGELKLSAYQEWKVVVESIRYRLHERERFVAYFESLVRGCLDITDARVDAALAESHRHVESRR
jgi:hypothetical protein